MASLGLDRVYPLDCMTGMDNVADASVDMILCDPPYGITAARWDTPLDLPALWAHYRRILKPRAAVVMMASQPFTTTLIASNIRNFKYTWVWNKNKAGNILIAKYQPMKIHEDICVFSYGGHNYYPVMTLRDKPVTTRIYGSSGTIGNGFVGDGEQRTYTHKNPTTILNFTNADQRKKINPTQKPLPLFEYLISTYTLPGQTVMDNCMGSFTTAIACANLDRRYIGFENDPQQYAAGNERLIGHLHPVPPDGAPHGRGVVEGGCA